MKTTEAVNEDSGQTVQMRMLIWFFSERTCPKVYLLIYSFFRLIRHKQ